MTRTTSRKQFITGAIAAIALVDGIGIYVAQHRLSQPADASAAGTPLAYAVPEGPELFHAGPPRVPAGALDAPALALAAPITAVPQPAATAPALSAPQPHLAITTPAPVLADAPPARLAAVAAAAPILRQPASAAAVVRTVALRAAPAPAARADAPATTTSQFASAFSGYTESPSEDYRFGQTDAEQSDTTLAQLVPERAAETPLFDKAGVGEVTGQTAAVADPAPVAAELPAVDAELAPIKG